MAAGEGDPQSRVRRVALALEYDGTGYSGSQYQENAPSIQGALEAAINNLTGERTRVAFAGRTDAGVHALCQVAAFDTRASLEIGAFVSGLNHFLPDDIAVKRALDVDPAFDPRRHATNRVYAYRIDNRRVRSPLMRNRVWHVERPLDVAALARAARSLEGTHDFAAFAGPYDGSTVRSLRCCQVLGDCGQVTLRFEAQSFLPHQVRRTVGQLVDVGLGRLDVERIARLLDEAIPSSAGPAAPACGLYLAHIEYDGLDFGSEQ